MIVVASYNGYWIAVTEKTKVESDEFSFPASSLSNDFPFVEPVSDFRKGKVLCKSIKVGDDILRNCAFVDLEKSGSILFRSPIEVKAFDKGKHSITLSSKEMQASWNGRIIAISNETLVLEGFCYFPDRSIKLRSALQHSTHTTMCPWKGKARYYNLVIEGKKNENCAFYYDNPIGTEAEKIKGERKIEHSSLLIS